MFNLECLWDDLTDGVILHFSASAYLVPLKMAALIKELIEKIINCEVSLKSTSKVSIKCREKNLTFENEPTL